MTCPASALWTVAPVRPGSLRNGFPGTGSRGDGVAGTASQCVISAEVGGLLPHSVPGPSSQHCPCITSLRVQHETSGICPELHGVAQEHVVLLGFPDMQQCASAHALSPPTRGMKGASGPWGQRVVHRQPARTVARTAHLPPNRGRCAGSFPALAPRSHTVPPCGTEHTCEPALRAAGRRLPSYSWEHRVV